MRFQWTQFVIPLICGAGILPSLNLILRDFQRAIFFWSDAVFGVCIFLLPFMIMAIVGYRAAKSSKYFPFFLSAAGLMAVLSLKIVAYTLGGNGQGGMGVLFIGVVQWLILVFTTITFAVLHNK